MIKNDLPLLRFQIRHYRYSVYLVKSLKHEGRPVAGLCEPAQRRIQISTTKMRPRFRKETLMHELFHAWFRAHGSPPNQSEEELAEMVGIFSNSMMDQLKGQDGERKLLEYALRAQRNQLEDSASAGLKPVTLT